MQNARLSRQFFFVSAFSALAFFALSLFGFIDLFGYKKNIIGAFELTGAVLVAANALHLYFFKNIGIAKDLLLLALLFGFVGILVLGGLANTGILWFFVFPFAAFFLSGKEEGARWMILIYIASFLAIALSFFGIFILPYQPLVLLQLFASLLAVTVFIYLYQDRIEREIRTTEKLTKSLEKDRDQMRTVVSSMAEGLLVVDAEYRITEANPAADTLLSKNSGGLIGRDIREAITTYKGEEKIASGNRPVSEALAEKKTVVIREEDNYYYQGPAGKKFPITSSVASIIVGNDIAGAVLVFHDITEDKKIEESKTNFVATASHQLRTPLTSMRWFSEMLIAGDAGELNTDQRHFIERVYHGTERMIRLVQFLLQMALAESGKIRMETASCDVKVLTESAVRSFRDAENISDRIIEVQTKSPIPSVAILGQEQAAQVLGSILSNAVLYSPKESVIIVTVRKKDTEIEWEIEDHGMGIAEKDQPRVFEKFFRAEKAVELSPDGWGLGLTTAKYFVDAWGGKIWFESEEGKGTRFYFTTPVL